MQKLSYPLANMVKTSPAAPDDSASPKIRSHFHRPNLK